MSGQAGVGWWTFRHALARTDGVEAPQPRGDGDERETPTRRKAASRHDPRGVCVGSNCERRDRVVRKRSSGDADQEQFVLDEPAPALRSVGQPSSGQQISMYRY